ncbi:hypothetical protein [Chlorobium phaeovibrioides]|uniref:DUF2294 family protein n=1 Tax=Chlorobium phaeovibrioides TaxID=1094 RepID=A0ABW9UQH4_CHLPH|nr:hypothetical protein [Chlorobium phaeovibrioides]MWV54172.1 hypothetical protein [Chlorobium phaeovibrioides]
MAKRIKMDEDERFSGVLADLEAIRQDILESGRLAELTGTEDCDFAVAFDRYGRGNTAEPAIFIKIQSAGDFDVDDGRLDDFEDFVVSRISDASLEWTMEVKELLGDDRLVVLLINGEEC